MKLSYSLILALVAANWAFAAPPECKLFHDPFKCVGDATTYIEVTGKYDCDAIADVTIAVKPMGGKASGDFKSCRLTPGKSFSCSILANSLSVLKKVTLRGYKKVGTELQQATDDKAEEFACGPTPPPPPAEDFDPLLH